MATGSRKAFLAKVTMQGIFIESFTPALCRFFFFFNKDGVSTIFMLQLVITFCYLWFVLQSSMQLLF